MAVSEVSQINYWDSAMQDIHTLHEAVKNRFIQKGAYESASEHSNKIYQIARQAIKAVVKKEPTGEIPLPCALLLAEIIDERNVRCCRPLLKKLSKLCRIFSELVFFKSFQEDRKIVENDRNKFEQSMQRICNTLPETDVETRFHLDTAVNAAKAVGSTKTIFDYLSPSIVSGISTVANQVNEKPKGGDLFSGGLKFVTGIWKIYKDLKIDGAFVDCYHWSWMTELVNTVDEFVEFENIIKEEHKQSDTAALFAAEALVRILENSETDDALKEQLIGSSDQEKMNLYHFASLETHSKKYWKASYLAVEAIIQLGSTAKYEYACISNLVNGLAGDTREQVSQRIWGAYQNSTNKDLWKQIVDKITPEQIRKCNKEAQERLKEIVAPEVVEHRDDGGGTLGQEKPMEGTTTKEDLTGQADCLNANLEFLMSIAGTQQEISDDGS